MGTLRTLAVGTALGLGVFAAPAGATEGAYQIAAPGFACGEHIRVNDDFARRDAANLRAVLRDLRGFGFDIRRTNSTGNIEIRTVTTDEHPEIDGFAAYTYIDPALILLNATQGWENGWQPRHGLSRTLAHELGHALGLAHVDDRGEIMHGGTWANEWGPGTERGLQTLACN